MTETVASTAQQTHASLFPEVIKVTDTAKEGRDIELRPITDADLGKNLPLSDAALQHLPKGVAASVDAMRSEMSRGGQLWGIHPVAEGGSYTHEPIGVVGFTYDGSLLETGTVLFSPEQNAGKGYGTAAKLGVMTIAHELYYPIAFGARIAAGNTASQRSAEKVGFVPVPETLARSQVWPTGPDGTPVKWEPYTALNSAVPSTLGQSMEAHLKALERYKVEAQPTVSTGR